MNVTLRVKEHQLVNVLAALGKANDNVDIVIDIKDGESERMLSGLKPGNTCEVQNEVEQLQEEEKEEEDEEQKEKEKKK